MTAKLSLMAARELAQRVLRAAGVSEENALSVARALAAAEAASCSAVFQRRAGRADVRSVGISSSTQWALKAPESSS